MPPRVRKAALVLHIGSSVGWLGAVITFLALAITAAATADENLTRALYISMDVIGRTALVPLSVATLVTGIIQSLGTQWGLIRHYWVIVKLVITLISTVILVLYIQTLTALAEAALDPATGIGPGEVLPNLSPVLHATAALLVLTAALGLSIYKPRGLTGFGLPVRPRSASLP
ncbi:DUF2269 domain-containing protein [Arthrobacter sp. TMS2-4]